VHYEGETSGFLRHPLIYVSRDRKQNGLLGTGGRCLGLWSSYFQHAYGLSTLQSLDRKRSLQED